MLFFMEILTSPDASIKPIVFNGIGQLATQRQKSIIKPIKGQTQQMEKKKGIVVH